MFFMVLELTKKLETAGKEESYSLMLHLLAYIVKILI